MDVGVYGGKDFSKRYNACDSISLLMKTPISAVHADVRYRINLAESQVAVGKSSVESTH